MKTESVVGTNAISFKFKNENLNIGKAKKKAGIERMTSVNLKEYSSLQHSLLPSINK